MEFFQNIFDVVRQETVAVYLVGIVGFIITIRQLRRNFQLKKKAETFESISNDIKDASELATQLNNSTNTIINDLANAADSMSFDVSNKTNKQLADETSKRSEVFDDLKRRLQRHSDDTASSAYKTLVIIKNIEKSTVIKESTRRAARYLYYEVMDQYDRMKAANSILNTLEMVPLVGGSPNITPESFRAIRELIIQIGSHYTIISGYLNDLEIIVHNDLVRKIYGKAKNDTLPNKHLTKKGIVDSRTQKPLL